MVSEVWCQHPRGYTNQSTGIQEGNSEQLVFLKQHLSYLIFLNYKFVYICVFLRTLYIRVIHVYNLLKSTYIGHLVLVFFTDKDVQ